MKKAIGIILLWAIGGTLGGVPIWLVVIVAGGIFAACYLGVYHKYISVGAGITFLWGLGVIALGLPSMPAVYDNAPKAVAETTQVFVADFKTNKDSFKTEVAGALVTNVSEQSVLMEKLSEIKAAHEGGLISTAEFNQMREQILKDFSATN